MASQALNRNKYETVLILDFFYSLKEFLLESKDLFSRLDSTCNVIVSIHQQAQTLIGACSDLAGAIETRKEFGEFYEKLTYFLPFFRTTDFSLNYAQH